LVKFGSNVVHHIAEEVDINLNYIRYILNIIDIAEIHRKIFRYF
jgi:hypothetical protein